MNSLSGILDAFICTLVVTVAVDCLRRLKPRECPLLSSAFYLVAIGAFGDLLNALQGEVPSLFTVLLHGGIVLHAWNRRSLLFTSVSK